MGNAAMCKVCGSDKGLRTGSRSHLDQNALPDYYCEDHCPVQTPLVRAAPAGAQETSQTH